MSEKIIYSDADRFAADVLASEKPVVVDFYSEDCPPCAALAPMFERLAAKYGDKMRFVKIFRQDNRRLAESLNVFGSPTLLFFRDGKEAGERLSGYINKPDLRRAIEAVLGISAEAAEKPVIKCDVIILGGGPAGLTAGIYTGRAKLQTVLLDQGLPGGQAGNTYHIANFPGTGGTIGGRELMDRILAQTQSVGVRVEDFKEIFSVDLTGEQKQVVTEDAIFTAPALIIATGAQPRKLPADGARELEGRGVHYCATCDGPMYEGQQVVVVGGGNSAVEEAIYLTRFAEKVTIVHEFDHLQASKSAQEEAFRNPKIEFIWECHARRVEGEDQMTGITLRHLTSGEERFVPASAAFVYIGTEPQTELFRGQLEMTKQGYIVTDAEMRASIPGVFAAGDVRVKEVRQAVTAAGDGAVAAVQAERYLAEQKPATREAEPATAQRF